MGEASHRTPFMWRYPKKVEPREGTINNMKEKYKLAIFNPSKERFTSRECKFPASTFTPRWPSWSSTTWTATRRQTAAVSFRISKPAKLATNSWKKTIMTHAYTPGNVHAIRKDNMKCVPGVEELINIEFDPEEKNNLINKENQSTYLSYFK